MPAPAAVALHADRAALAMLESLVDRPQGGGVKAKPARRALRVLLRYLSIIRWRLYVFVGFDIHARLSRACAVVRSDRYIMVFFRNDHGIGFAMVDDCCLVMQWPAVVDDRAAVVIGNNHSFISQSWRCGKESRDRKG